MKKSAQMKERAINVLKMLVNQHISEGQPVGSKTLSSHPDISVSSATIRNILAELEEQGYVRSVHTSSGRIPTNKAYRLFVDSLLSIKTDSATIHAIENELNQSVGARELVTFAPTVLSQMTHFAGLISLPKSSNQTLRHIEFLKLSDQKVLVILVVNEQEVQNRILSCQKDFSREELEQAANYINQNYTGQTLSRIRTSLISAMHSDKETINDLMSSSIELAEQAMATETVDNPKEDYVVEGKENLLSFLHNTDVEHIKDLLKTFGEKQSMLHLIDRCQSTNGIQLFIGKESGIDVLDDFSIVAAPYHNNNDVVGVLGVIGPTRMHYDKVIPIVDVTAKLITKALDKGSNS